MTKEYCRAMSTASFRGVSAEQDGRFGDKVCVCVWKRRRLTRCDPQSPPPPAALLHCTHTSPNLHTHKSTPSIPTRSHMAGRRCLPTSACVCVCMGVGPQMKKLLKSTKFPPHFDRKVDMRKVFLSHSPISPHFPRLSHRILPIHGRVFAPGEARGDDAMDHSAGREASRLPG